MKRPFSGTFSNSLKADLPQKPLPPALLRLSVRKVPTEAAFLRHLLEFVIIQPASEASLTGIAPAPRQEGADRSGLSPAPSRIRYNPTRLRSLSHRHCPGSPSGRCRPKRTFSGTFSNSLKADQPQKPLPPALNRLPVRKVPTEAVFLRHLLEFVIIQPASEASLTGIVPAPRPEVVLISRGNFPPSEGGDAVERAVADLKVNEFESFARRFDVTRRQSICYGSIAWTPAIF